jgi:GNAT superfamily N-acetyltransferase
MSLTGDLSLDSVVEIERIALGAWPGLEVGREGGWLVRCANGVTRRANSVWPNAKPPDGSLEECVTRIEAFYHSRGLPARFQICPAAQPAVLDEWLAQRGYRAVARTAVQTTSLLELRTRLGAQPQHEVHIEAMPSTEWWACYATADEVTPASVAGRQQICAAIEQSKAFATVFNGGSAIAVASAAVAAGWIGFFNIATLPSHRRMGAARAVMATLASWGEESGASDAYLQVMADNRAALRLYEELGFTTGYFYHYREEPWSPE